MNKQQRIYKEVTAGDKLQGLMLEGLRTVATAVGCTAGPDGDNVYYEYAGVLGRLTKDGVSIARQFDLKDKKKAIGARLAITAAEQAVAKAGDGTTATVVNTLALVEACIEALDNSTYNNKRELILALEKDRDSIIEILQSDYSTKIEQSDLSKIIDVATIASNGDEELGKVVGECVSEVGLDGVITFEENPGESGHRFEINEGYKLNKGIIMDGFANNGSNCSFANPNILITDRKIRTVQEIMPVIEKAQESGRPFVLIAGDPHGEVVSSFLMTKNMKGAPIAVIKKPVNNEYEHREMEDLALYLGAKYFSDTSYNKEWSKIEEEDFGTCDIFDSSIRSTNFLTTKKEILESVEERIANLKEQLKSANKTDEEMLNFRIQALTGKNGKIVVGGQTDLESGEAMDRADDAVKACKAAIEEGIVDGGGMTYLRLASHCKSPLKDSLKSAIKQMLKNSLGKFTEAEEMMKKLDVENLDNGMGIDISKMEVVNMMDEGIIDPSKVARICIEKSVSAAISFIKIHAAVTEDK